MTYEDEILARNSTPGLRRNELDRTAKKDHLAGLKVSREESDKILNQLYPEENTNERPSQGNTRLPAAQAGGADSAQTGAPATPAPGSESDSG